MYSDVILLGFLLDLLGSLATRQWTYYLVLVPIILQLSTTCRSSMACGGSTYLYLFVFLKEKRVFSSAFANSFSFYPFHQFKTQWSVVFLQPFALLNLDLQSYGGYDSGYGGGGGYGGGSWGGGGGGDRMSNLGGGLRNVDWANTKLEHFEKNFYIEDKRVSARSEAEIDQFKREKEMKVRVSVCVAHSR